MSQKVVWTQEHLKFFKGHGIEYVLLSAEGNTMEMRLVPCLTRNLAKC